MATRPLRALRYLGLAAAVVLPNATPSGRAEAHTLWMAPKPRDQMDGYKPIRTPGFVLPCGVARSPAQPQNPLAGGVMQMVTWKETTPHPGCFVIEFAMSDAGPFQRLAVEPHPPQITANRTYNKMIMLPDVECTDCVLRIRQYMANANPCPPTNLMDMDPNLYYSCANISLKKGGGGPSDGGAPDTGAPDTRQGGGGSGGSGGSGGTGGGGSGGGNGGTSGSGGSTGGSGGGGNPYGGSSGSGGSTGGSGGDTGGTGGTTPPPRRAPAGGCAVGGQGSAGGLLLLALVLLFRRRRR
jgi:MYXO-CTERM domain-containing protein